MSGRSPTSREDIVITGISCRFAGIASPSDLWETIIQRQSGFAPAAFNTKFSGSDSPECFTDARLPKNAALLGDLYSCNPSAPRFPRRISDGENPDLYFALQLVTDALANGGSEPGTLQTDRVSLRLGYAPPTNPAVDIWMQHTCILRQTIDLIRKCCPGASGDQLDSLCNQLRNSLPPTSPDGILSSFGSNMAAHISRLLGLSGPAAALDGGCCSGIHAVQQAMDDLLSKRADIAVAGALQPPFPAHFIQGIAPSCQFSERRQLKPFSRDSNGTIPGEGGGFLVLKRLKDAMRQGDRIYAIIRGCGFSVAPNDRILPPAPQPEPVNRAVSRALHSADCSPASIRLIEAHGSGIPTSDTAELRVFRSLCDENSSRSPMTGIGSVKGNIGHTLWASGIAGIIKAALAIYHRTLPPQIPVERHYPRFFGADSPLYILNESRPWLNGDRKIPRRACVSCIDFTGSCAAAVLEEHPEAAE
ncbi:MAG: polyketide synthase [Kiritimatiellae bacterium]|nr:polyketide synthase [Kiritimatiellia bacterium]